MARRDCGTWPRAQQQLVLAGHKDSVWCVAVSPDSKTVATGSIDETIRLWDAATGRSLATLDRTAGGHRGWVNAVAFSPDGKRLASASWDETAKLWDLSGKKPRLAQTLPGHGHWVWAVSFSPDGQTLATGSEDKTVNLWNLEGDYRPCSGPPCTDTRAECYRWRSPPMAEPSPRPAAIRRYGYGIPLRGRSERSCR